MRVSVYLSELTTVPYSREMEAPDPISRSPLAAIRDFVSIDVTATYLEYFRMPFITDERCRSNPCRLRRY